MIHYDLICEGEHGFDAWFKDSAAFERQKRRKQVVCPVCGSTKVGKALMAPAIARGRSEESQKQLMAAGQAVRALAAMRKHVEQNCDYVGERFADEALKIHHGEVEKRDIYGEATDDQARSLKEEGVAFARIPWGPRLDN